MGYNLSVDDRLIIKNASLGVILDQAFSGKFKVVDSQYELIDERYEMDWYKNKQIHNKANEIGRAHV